MSNNSNRDFDVSETVPDGTKYQEKYENSYAVVVGIDTYSHPRLRPLGKAEEDAQSIANILGSQPYGFQVELLLGSQASRQAITKALNNLVKISKLDDRIIFYFAGHGYIQADIREIDVGYLACADTDPENPYDGLRYDDVTELARFSKAKHIAFILDACFSGNALGMTRAVVQPAAVNAYLRHKGYQVLTAGAVEAVSDARSMTGELVKVLREGIPGQKGVLTFSQLGQHIHDVIHTKSQGRQSPVYGLLEGSGKGQLILLTPKAIDQLPQDLRQGLTHTEPLMRRFAIGEAETLLDNPDYTDAIRAVLDEMLDDADPEVRRRAAQVLYTNPSLTHPPTTIEPEPTRSQTQEPDSQQVTIEPEPSRSQTPDLDVQQSSLTVDDLDNDPEKKNRLVKIFQDYFSDSLPAVSVIMRASNLIDSTNWPETWKSDRKNALTGYVETDARNLVERSIYLQYFTPSTGTSRQSVLLSLLQRIKPNLRLDDQLFFDELIAKFNL